MEGCVMSLGIVRKACKDGISDCTSLNLALRDRFAVWTKGVAFAYSATMLLWIFPVIAWSVIPIRDDYECEPNR